MIHFTPACCCSSVRRFTASPTPSAVCFLLFVLSLKGFGEKIQSRQDAQTLLVRGGCFEYFIVWFIFAKDSKNTNWFSFSCSTFTAQLYIQIQIQHNVPINLTAVAQITVILLMSSMKEIALHLEESRYWQ